MTQYKTEADKVIQNQNSQLYICKDSLEAEKKKQSYLIPGLSLVVGFVLGFFILK